MQKIKNVYTVVKYVMFFHRIYRNAINIHKVALISKVQSKHRGVNVF